MSFTSTSALTAGLPAIGQAQLPADIRNGNAAAKQAYTEALGFEQVLVNQLAQELSKTVSSSGSSSSGGSSGDGSTGLLGSDPSTSGFSDLLPQALTSTIISGGGLGIAREIAQSLDPALAGRPARAQP